ncbi:hypothetical protein LTR06_010031 [Exophiala xenobiotica]|nr:hypothetical protein LTR06_010031 [Exophiala xenobiotica]
MHKTYLHGSKGVAISYAWGEFDREERRVGHFRDSPDHAVIMELGSEWRVSSVQERLAQLTKQHDGCWVDQICMPRKEEKIRQALAAIPAIFRTLPVTVLLPGSLYGCLRKAFDEYQAAKLKADEQQASADQPSEASARLDRCMKHLDICLFGMGCLNSNGASSWTKRLWTLQEIFFSKSCSFLFANQEVMQCYKIEDSINIAVKPEQLNDYSRRLYEDLVKQRSHSSDDVVREFFRHENNLTRVSLEFPLVVKATDFDLPIRLASLLLGDRQVWDLAGGRQRGPREDLKHVTFTLEAITTQPRTATQPKDYILSMFPAVDGYIIPGNLNHLSPTELLEDALAQLFGLENVFIPNLSPMGLIGNICPSAQWSPDLSRAAFGIGDSTDIYGSFLYSKALIVRSPACLPLKLPSVPTTTSLGQNAHNFDTWVEVMVREWENSYYDLRRFHKRFGVSWEEAVAKLESSSKSERVVGLMRILSEIPSGDRHKTREDVISTMIEMLVRLDVLISAREVEKAIHGLTCEFLHLDATRCRQHGVRTIFSLGHGVVQQGGQEEGMFSHSCVGLVNGHSFDQAISSGAELLTIALDVRPETPFYEAVKIPGTSPPEYRIIGVWAPLHRNFRVAEIGAIMVHQHQDHNAYVV